MFEKTLRMALLFDAYGSLLTEKQQQFFELYYSDDLSLGEIADQFDVSRQAVYDILKRSEKALTTCEDKLHLVKTEQQTDQVTQAMMDALNNLEKTLSKLPPPLQEEVAASMASLKRGMVALQGNAQEDNCDV